MWAIALCLWLRSSACADGGVITKAIEDLAALGSLGVLVEEGEAVLQGGTCEVGIPVREK